MKLRRNELCGCGSGKKYKKCCGAPRAANPRKPPQAFNVDLEMTSAEGYQRAQMWGDAKRLYRRVLAVQPANARALHNLGWIAHAEGDNAAALQLIRDSLGILPDEWSFHFNLARILHQTGEFAAAGNHYERAAALNAGFSAIHNYQAILMVDRGKAREAVDCFERATAAAPHDSIAFSNYLHALNQLPGMPPATIFNEHLRFGREFARPPLAPHQAHVDADPQRRLRLGYVSGDFRDFAVAWFIEPVLAHHDHTAFEVYAYSNHRGADAVTARVRAHTDHWRSIAAVGDVQAARMIQADGIDILVDLSGHTRENRLPMFACKPAPIQVSWLGYFNTTGLSAINYLISDPVSSPPEDTQAFVETLLRLPHSRLCYQAPEYAPPVASLPARANYCVTIGTFNKLAKLNDDVVSLWSDVLRSIPGSRLLLKARAFGDDTERRNFEDRFSANGIAADRLMLRPHSPHASMLAEYADIDIALDPFPFSGGLTTCEALWQGVPVVTLRGNSLVSRQSASFLTELGLGDWIADSREDYLARATRMAGDLDSLAHLRAGLRERMKASPVCDSAGFTRDLERLYRGVWENFCVEARAAGAARNSH